MGAFRHILIGDADGDRIRLTVPVEEPPGRGDDFWDANWVRSGVQINAQGFRATYHAYLRTDELSSFLHELEALARTTEGVASYHAMEHQLEFTLTGDALGRVLVEGSARDSEAVNRLSFEFSIDQTYLPEIIRATAAFLERYPVVGHPDA